MHLTTLIIILLAVLILIAMLGIFFADLFMHPAWLSIMLFSVIAVPIVVFCTYEANCTFDHEIESQSILEAKLGTTGRSGTPCYIISYEDENENDNDKIKIRTVYEVQYTTEESHISESLFRWGPIYSEKYVYFINKDTLNKEE